MSTFPSIISTISDPAATNKLNSPSHSSIEQAQNDGIKKLETFVGTLSSAAGTLMYDIRAAASDGGGHVQATNKGGTGQTSYTKGDTLIGSSSSVLTKLAVGSNNQVLMADSAQATGVKWATLGSSNTTVVIDNTATNYVNATADDTTWYSESIPGSTLGATGGIMTKIFFRAIATANTYSPITFRLKYGSNTMVTSSMAGAAFNVGTLYGYVESLITANAATNSQIGSFKLFATTNVAGATPTFLSAGGNGTSSIESSANQNLILSIQTGVGDSVVSVLGHHCAITKI